jgi:hypothetical protein
MPDRARVMLNGRTHLRQSKVDPRRGILAPELACHLLKAGDAVFDLLALPARLLQTP